MVYEYRTATRNTTNTSNANVHYSRYGRFVVLTGWFIPSSNGIAAGKEILTGLIRPNMNTNVFVIDQSTMATYYLELQDASTTIKVNNAMPSSVVGHYLNIQCTYLIGTTVE